MILILRLQITELRESEDTINGLNVMVINSVVMWLLTLESNVSVKLNLEKNHTFVLKRVNSVKDAMVLSSMVLEKSMVKLLLLQKWWIKTTDTWNTTKMEEFLAPIEEWKEIQTMDTKNNATVMMSSLSIFKRSKLMKLIIDKKKKSEETREDWDLWLSKEEDISNKKKKEELDFKEKEKFVKKEDLKRKLD